jgi:hypothetical protein
MEEVDIMAEDITEAVTMEDIEEDTTNMPMW